MGGVDRQVESSSLTVVSLKSARHLAAASEEVGTIQLPALSVTQVEVSQSTPDLVQEVKGIEVDRWRIGPGGACDRPICQNRFREAKLSQARPFSTLHSVCETEQNAQQRQP